MDRVVTILDKFSGCPDSKKSSKNSLFNIAKTFQTLFHRGSKSDTNLSKEFKDTCEESGNFYETAI